MLKLVIVVNMSGCNKNKTRFLPCEQCYLYYMDVPDYWACIIQD